MITEKPKSRHYDLVVVGSGFGSLFFLAGYMARKPNHRVLLLERGTQTSHASQLQLGRNSAVKPETTYSIRGSAKRWNFTIGWGGGMNCWWAQAPRMHPSDFVLRSSYGVGVDWPISYDDLQAHYNEAETIMSVAGSALMANVLPRNAPFPQPAHMLSSVDELLLAAQPTLHVPISTARASTPKAGRGKCCSAARCNLCPMDAKFTQEHGFAWILDDARIEVALEHEVVELLHDSSAISGVKYAGGTVSGDLFVLGANALHSPAILLRSGMETAWTGNGLNEQIGCNVEVLLDGLDHFDGGTATTALNYSLYDGPWRREMAAVLIYFENRWVHGLRTDQGRWRQTLPLTLVAEDLPSHSSRVTVSPAGWPEVEYAGPSAYATRGISAAVERLAGVLSPLPVEAIQFRGMRPTESHIQGTLRMGNDPAHSVVDRHLIHHKWRNLVVVGSSVFPSCSPANPSLTVAALSLHSAAAIV